MQQSTLTTIRTGTGSRKVFEYEFTVTNTQNGEVLVTHDGYSQITALSRIVIDNTAPSTTEDPTITTANNKLKLTVKTNEEVKLDNITIGTQRTTNFLRNLSHEGKITNGTGGAALNYPTSVFVQGNYAYIASYESNTLEIVNISNPATPTHAGKITHGTGGAVIDYPTSVFVEGNYAYITSLYEDSLEIVNISSCADNDDATPCSPTHEGKIYHGRTSGKDINGNEYTIVGADTNGAAIDYPFNVFVQGDYAYVVSRNSDALEIVDVSTPSNPIHIGKITNGTGGAALDYPRSVFVKGNYAYITSLDSHALEIVNISEPATPTHEGKIYSGRLSGRDSSNEEYTDGADTNGNGEFKYYEDVDGNGAALTTPSSVFVEGNYAYVTSQYRDALEIVDVSTPSNPIHIGKIYNGRLDGTATSALFSDGNGAALDLPNSVFVRGDYAYVVSEGGRNDALEVINISDKTNPTHAGKIKNGTNGAVLNGPESVFVQGNYAYVVSYNSDALEIVELENTYTAEVAGTDTDSAYGVTIKDATGHTNRYGTVPEFATTSITTKSNNTNPRAAKNGDTITVTMILAKEVSIVPNKPVITVGSTIIDRDDITVVTTIPTNQTKDTFEYSFHIISTHSGEVTVAHNGNDKVTALSRIVVDNTAPNAIGTPTLTTSNADNTKAEVGDILTLTVSTNKEVLFNNATLGGETINFQRNISHEGKITTEGRTALSSPQSTFVQGGYAYIVSSHLDALEIVNISDPSSPTHAGKIYNGRVSGKDSEGNEYTSAVSDTNGAALDSPQSVFVQGNYAYIASSISDALEIVNISDPTNPTHAGKITHGTNGAALDFPNSVFVQGNYAYIASSVSDALEIVNISDPTNPIHTGKITNGTGGAALDNPHSVFVKDNYAYVASYNSRALEIVNISDPASPTHAGKIYNGRASGKDSSNNEYTTGGTDINGASLVLPTSVFVQGDYAYVVSEGGINDALEIVNISEPTNPTHAGKIINGTEGATLDNPHSVFVKDNYAYVASSASDALEIVEISDPTNPTHAGKIIDGTGGAALDNPQSVFVKDNYVYVASKFSNALEIIELENTYTTSIPITRQIANNKAFNSYSATIKDAVGNTRNVSQTFTAITTDIPPLDITSYSDTANGARDGYINSEETTGNLITALGIRAGTAQYAVTTPTTNCNANALTYTTTIPTTTSLSTDATYKVCARVVNGTKTSYNHDILITKDTTAPSTTEDPTLTTANNKLTLTVKTNEEVSLDDITIGTQEPTNFLRNISHEGKITDGTGGAALSRPRSVFVRGNYAYIVSSYSNALEIVNISDPSSPTHTGKITDGTNGAALDSPRSVFVQGNYAYIVSSISNALEIVNISDPTTPTHEGKIINGTSGAAIDSPQSVFVQGNYAYIASSVSDTLEIVDISEPTKPTHAGKITNGTGGAALDFPNSVFVKGNYAYIASATSNALEIVDISDPANPTHAGKIYRGRTDGTYTSALNSDGNGAALNGPNSVFVQGNYAYIVSTISDALEIVNISDPDKPNPRRKDNKWNRRSSA